VSGLLKKKTKKKQGLTKPGGLVIVDDCDETAQVDLFGWRQVNTAWKHSLALGVIKPLPVKFDSCEHVGLCIGRFA
jgi:hypothetical protein